MKEELFTIPVNEALEKDGECLFCVLNEKLEGDILNYVLGPSYMEEDVRGETDKIGFCKKHYRQMYGAQNRLGVALIMQSHIKNFRENLKGLLDDEIKNSSPKKGLFKKTKQPESSSLNEYLDEVENSCYACRRMEARMASYIDTFFYLWKKELEFREKILSSKGFCIEHFNMIIKEARKKLSEDKYKAFINEVSLLELKNLDIMQDDVDWFVQKFDYRFNDEPWKNSKDALPRAILKMSAEDVENN